MFTSVKAAASYKRRAAMNILTGLGRVSTETRTLEANSIQSDANVGDPFTGPNSPRYCYSTNGCTEMYVRHGKTKVDGDVFSLRSSDCKDAKVLATVFCVYL
jgi:hypothetical protein